MGPPPQVLSQVTLDKFLLCAASLLELPIRYNCEDQTIYKASTNLPLHEVLGSFDALGVDARVLRVHKVPEARLSYRS